MSDDATDRGRAQDGAAVTAVGHRARSREHAVFLDGVTGYLGRWTLFWLLEELPDERIAVLIRPRSRGGAARSDLEQRLDDALRCIGKQSERDRISVMPGDLALPSFGNPALLQDLRAAVWVHLAGDVRFKPLGGHNRIEHQPRPDHELPSRRRPDGNPPAESRLPHLDVLRPRERVAAERHQVPKISRPEAMEHDNASAIPTPGRDVPPRQVLITGGLPVSFARVPSRHRRPPHYECGG